MMISRAGFDYVYAFVGRLRVGVTGSRCEVALWGYGATLQLTSGILSWGILGICSVTLNIYLKLLQYNTASLFLHLVHLCSS